MTIKKPSGVWGSFNLFSYNGWFNPIIGLGLGLMVLSGAWWLGVRARHPVHVTLRSETKRPPFLKKLRAMPVGKLPETKKPAQSTDPTSLHRRQPHWRGRHQEVGRGECDERRRLKELVTPEHYTFAYASREESLRFMWIGALAFQLGLMILLTQYAMNLIWRNTKPSSTQRIVSYALPVIVFCIVILKGLAGSDDWTPLHGQLFALMQYETDNTVLDKMTSGFNAWGGAIGMLVAMAVLMLILTNLDATRRIQEEPLSDGELALAKSDSSRSREQFRRLLFMSAAFLVAMTFQIYCEFSWPAAMFDNEQVATAVKGIAASAAYAYGAMFTVLGGFVFMPGIAILNADDGFTTKTISEVIAILAPLFAAISLTKIG